MSKKTKFTVKRRKKDRKTWEGIFGYTRKSINKMVGDMECDMACGVMLDLMDNYYPPRAIEDVHTGIKL